MVSHISNLYFTILMNPFHLLHCLLAKLSLPFSHHTAVITLETPVYASLITTVYAEEYCTTCRHAAHVYVQGQLWIRVNTFVGDNFIAQWQKVGHACASCQEYFYHCLSCLTTCCSATLPIPQYTTLFPLNWPASFDLSYKGRTQVCTFVSP